MGHWANFGAFNSNQTQVWMLDITWSALFHSYGALWLEGQFYSPTCLQVDDQTISLSSACIWAGKARCFLFEKMLWAWDCLKKQQNFRKNHLAFVEFWLNCFLHYRECHCFKNYYRVHINIISPKCLAVKLYKVSERELVESFSYFLIPLNSLIKSCSHPLCRKYIYLNLVVVFETMTFSVVMLKI